MSQRLDGGTLESSRLVDLNIFDCLLDSVVALDEGFNVLYANSTFATLCGTSNRRIQRKPKPLAEYIQIDDTFFQEPSLKFDPSFSEMYREVSFSVKSAEGESTGTLQFSVQERCFIDQQKVWILFFRDVTLEKSLHDKYKAQLQAKENVIEDLKIAQQELKNYSIGLEQMVEERTRKLQSALEFQKATLDCLGQGFFVFDAEGTILPSFSKVCPEMFGRSPSGHKVWEIFNLPEDQGQTLKAFVDTVFMETLPFEDLSALLDLDTINILGRTLKVELYPLRSEEGTLRGVVVVSTDITQELEIQKQLVREKGFAEMITQILRYPKQYLGFVRDSSKIIESLLSGAEQDSIFVNSEETSRHLHTLKGGASSFYLQDLVDVVHEVEERFKVDTSHHQSENSSGRRGDWPQNFRLIKEAFEKVRADVNDLMKIEDESSQRHANISIDVLSRWCRDLEDSRKARSVSREIFDQFLCEPLEDLLSHLGSEVLKTAHALDKKVRSLAISAQDIRVLPEFYSGVLSNLVHCLRNSVDHGIESPSERTELGKPEYGKIEIKCEVVEVGRSGSKLVIKVVDDGAGIDEAKVRSKLGDRGSSLSREQLLDAIFFDGFSTKDDVSKVSGMGVGVSSLKAEVVRLGGEVKVISAKGQGTTIELVVPMIRNLSDYVGLLMRLPKAA